MPDLVTSPIDLPTEKSETTTRNESFLSAIRKLINGKKAVDLMQAPHLMIGEPSLTLLQNKQQSLENEVQELKESVATINDKLDHIIKDLIKTASFSLVSG